MNYQNGRIYQILNHINDDIYVGSTTQSLSKRFSWHKGDSTKEKKQNYKLYRAMKEIGSENFYIELIENYPCNTKEELIAREQYYIRERGTLNSLIPGRNLAEYKIECRDQILQNKRLYYQKNKEIINKKAREFSAKNTEQRKKHYQEHKEEKKLYNLKNKKVINERRRINYRIKKSIKENALFVSEFGKMNLFE